MAKLNFRYFNNRNYNKNLYTFILVYIINVRVLYVPFPSKVRHYRKLMIFVLNSIKVFYQVVVESLFQILKPVCFRSSLGSFIAYFLLSCAISRPMPKIFKLSRFYIINHLWLFARYF